MLESFICVIIFNLNFVNYKSKSIQIKSWFKAWIMFTLNFIEMHKVKAKASAFDNNQKL
jgi:hypothetical protein